MDIGLKSVLVWIILAFQVAFIIFYWRREINHSNLEISCDDGWQPYKDEKCLKLFDTAGLLNYANAENICKEQNSFLISIDTAEKQEFVKRFLSSNSVVDNIWIGLKYENDILQWADGTRFHYSNWANEISKIDTSHCFQMETEAANFGLWSDEWCWKKHLVVCEKAQHLSLAQLEIKMMDLMRNSDQQRLASDAQFSSLTNTDKNLNLALTQLKTNLNSISSSTNLIQHLNSTLTQVQTSLTNSVSSLTNTDRNMNLALTGLKTNLTNSISRLTNTDQNMNLALTQLKTSLTNTISNLTNSIHYFNSTLTQVQTSLKSSVSSLTNTDRNMNSALTQLKTNLANSISSSTNLIQHLNSTLTQVQTSLTNSVSSLTNTDQKLNLDLTQLKTNLANSISSSTNSIQRLNLALNQSPSSLTQTTRNQILPVGFIYVQLPNEKPPAEIWPWMEWEDVSSKYAGLFFRTVGGNAAPFGKVQSADSPRLVSMDVKQSNDTFNSVKVLANNEYSKVLDIDVNVPNSDVGLRVQVSDGEVRPVNMAIRIWKRTK